MFQYGVSPPLPFGTQISLREVKQSGDMLFLVAVLYNRGHQNDMLKLGALTRAKEVLRYYVFRKGKKAARDARFRTAEQREPARRRH